MRGDALVSLQVVMTDHGGAGSVFFGKWWRPAVADDDGVAGSLREWMNG